MSVPIAVTGLIPNRKISSGVISVPPPMPVMPTSAPMPKPKMTIAGSMPPCHPHLVLLDFPDHFGWEYGLRQDTSDERLDWRGFALLRRPAHDRGARPRGRAAGRRRLGRPLRLRQVDLAGADLRLAGTRGREDLGRRRDPAELFDRFGLAGFETKAPGELSGGMRQRVAFLRTLVSGKPVLALDEPFAALDAITRAEMQEWLAAALRADPRTVVLVTHDVEEALYLADHVIVLSARPARIVAELQTPAPRATDRDAAVTAPDFVAARVRTEEHTSELQSLTNL